MQATSTTTSSNFNNATKYVASNTLTTHDWKKSVFLKGDDIVNELKKLKKQDGQELQVHGSGNLIQTLLKNDLVDEIVAQNISYVQEKSKQERSEKGDLRVN